MCRELVELSGFEFSTKKRDNNNNNNNKKPSTNTTSLSSANDMCVVCELMFRPPGSSNTSARALCKVFFHRSRRRHTVVVFAVPEDEWTQVLDLVKHAVVSVGELSHQNLATVGH